VSCSSRIPLDGNSMKKHLEIGAKFHNWMKNYLETGASIIA
jgi:hypothetical protein